MKHSILFGFLFFVITVSAQTKKTYIYAIKGLDTLKMDVYTPDVINPADSLGLPVLLWMHGGGFVSGYRDFPSEVKLAQYAAQNGYLGISISYRLTRKGTKTGFSCECPAEEKRQTFKMAAKDYLDAARYVIKNSHYLKADVTKIIAGGSSAGAEAILNAVFMKEFFMEDVKQYSDVKFAGVFSLSGAMINANFITEKNAIPMVLFHGTHDNLVPFNSGSHHRCKTSKPGYLVLDGSAIIVQKLKKLNTSYYFNAVKGAGHEVALIPFNQLDAIFEFFRRTVIQKEFVQTKIVKEEFLNNKY